MRERRPRRHTGRRRSVFTRFARFVRELFSSGRGPSGGSWDDDLEGGLGVREPRRPHGPTLSGAVVLETPPTESRDVWAVGEDDSR